MVIVKVHVPTSRYHISRSLLLLNICNLNHSSYLGLKNEIAFQQSPDSENKSEGSPY